MRFWMAFIKLPSPAAGRLVLASRGGRPVRPRKGAVPRACAVGLVIFGVASLGGARAAAATQAPTFVRADYSFHGNNFAVGDFNGDGRIDLAGTAAQAAAVRFGNGDGTLGPKVEFPVAAAPEDVAAGDFNGDGRLDLVVTIHDPGIALALLLGNGDGTFQAATHFANTTRFDSPAVAATDLNNDGNLDAVVAHSVACWTAPCLVTETMSVMLGNGDGTFQPTRDIQVGRGMSRIAVGDFNRDGVKDLGIAGDSSRVYLLLGVGDGTFRQQPTVTLTADTLAVDGSDIDVADFNGDTIQDLVVAIATNGSRTAILIGNDDGTFRAPLILTDPGLNVPHYVAVADFNRDGFQDLAMSLAIGNSGLMQIRNGNGDGTFQAPVQYLVPAETSSIGGFAIVAADFNGDAKPDLALDIVGAAPGLTILRNSTGVAAPPTPSAPTLLSPSQDATPAQPVTFDWTDVSAASTYRIQIDDSSNFSTPLIVDRTVTTSEFTAPTLAAKRHWWRVRGIDSAGTAGAWSTVRRFTPQPAAPAPTLSALSLSPTTVAGGNTAQGTATLTSAAPSGGAVVMVSTSNTSAAAVPTSVTVAAGATTASFTVGTSSVTASTAVAITGAYGGTTRSATLTVTPPGAPPALSALSVNPTSVTGGASPQGTVTLTSTAPAGGFAVALSSTNVAAIVPGGVTVPQGATSATFAIATSAVTTSTSVTITASAGDVTRSTTLTLTPAPQTTTLTVNATGRSGERVTSTPAGINVPVGSSGSASFSVGTSITLRATDDRDVIWSGDCSSGGSKTKTCTFTLSGNTTITANVQ